MVGSDMSKEDGRLPSAHAGDDARARPAETLDDLERRVLGARPEDLRQAHDPTEHTNIAEHDQDLDLQDLPGTEGDNAPPAEPPV